MGNSTERKSRRRAEQKAKNPGSLGVAVDFCNGCGHTEIEGGLMVGCSAGVCRWKNINSGFGVCHVARIEYENGHKS